VLPLKKPVLNTEGWGKGQPSLCAQSSSLDSVLIASESDLTATVDKKKKKKLKKSREGSSMRTSKKAGREKSPRKVTEEATLLLGEPATGSDPGSGSEKEHGGV
tara:strand:- start:174 stop:485 length:312 start_codon:yes stop_codon:yes gene_type:complete